MASVFSFGPLRADASLGGWTTGAASSNIERGSGGLDASILSLKSNADGLPMGPEVVGWDTQGPIAATEPTFAVQGGTPFIRPSRWRHLDATGNLADAIGGPDCVVMTSSSGGRVACRVGQSPFNQPTGVEIRDASGTKIWSGNTPKPEWIEAAALSPDGTQVAVGAPTSGGAFLLREAGAPTTLAAGFVPVDWLDAETLIGYAGDLNLMQLVTVKVADPARTIAFPVQGYYVGKIGLG
jgi:hypothetical protein